MNPADKSPREFWVTEYKNGDVRAFNRPIHPELEGFIIKETHVIEKSAYDKLQAELDELKDAKEELGAQANLDVHLLQSRLEKCEGLLRECVKWPNLTRPKVENYFNEVEK